ncbi:phage/plasmid primase, P4 family [Streptomyces sp. NPDC001380]|uniref:DNA primase family protein n=1 Tax=Streptomyces sp. NPDC001380 TaxID=3364566 RepID=UPI00367965EC
MTTEAEVVAFQAFQRDKARQEKARQALESADSEQLAAFVAWKEEQEAAAQKTAAQAAREAAAAEKKAKATAAAQAGGGTEMTDAVLAERVAQMVMHDRYCWSAGLGWMRWSGIRWERSPQQTVIEDVRQFLLESVNDQLRAPDTDWRKRQELMSLLSKSRITAVVELCKGVVQVRDDQFDTQPDLLNTPSGVVHLPTGGVRPHSPRYYLTKVTAVAYVPGATHPDWTKALEAVPAEARDWFQIRAGQGITGHMTPDDALLLLQGGGENGKSTVLESIARCLGDYEVFLSDRVLLADPGSHPTELMDLRGARFAVAEELPEGRKLSVKRLKDVIGTSRMKARYIRQDTVEWDATHSVFLSTNYLPVVEETDHGTWRRLMLLKFPYKFLKAHQEPQHPNERRGDPGLRERMKWGMEQRQAVLTWLIEGARRWYAADKVMPTPPACVAADSRAWRAESDLVLSYWQDRIEADPDSHVLARELFDDFNGWLSSRGHQKWSDKTFTARFGGHDETSAQGAERRKIRATSGLSRPPRSLSEWDTPTVPSTYWAWLGVRFLEDGVKIEDE